MQKDKILLHACCAPCAVNCIESLRESGFGINVFYFNPNIHPFKEYESRRSSLIELALNENIGFFEPEGYGLEFFLKNADWHSSGELRCVSCYEMRLAATAHFAKENGYTAFTTSLLISPYQKHGQIKAIGERLAEEFGLKFLYRDFRPLFRDGQNKARGRGYYMQKYCGCIFSEEERYRK